MSQRLTGKVAIVTGGTSGIGEETAKRFVAEGAKVMIVGRNREKGGAMVASLGPEARFFAADVSHESEVAAAVEATRAAFGRIDILFNNAGGPTPGDPDNATFAQYRHAVDLLLGSVVMGIRHVAPIMIEQRGGAIISNSSVSALRGNMGDYLYSAAKAGVKRVTEIAGLELGRHGVRVNCISPGAIATPIFFGGSRAALGLAAGEAEAKLEKLTRNLSKATPLRRAGTPADIAAAAVFLASEDASFVNCHDLVVDGGMVAGGRTDFS